MHQWAGSNRQPIIIVKVIIWTNGRWLPNGPSGTNFSEKWIKIQTFSLKKYRPKNVVWKMPAIYSVLSSSPPSAAYMCQWIGSALVQIMAWCLFGTKPLSKPMLGYCQSDHREQTSVKVESKYKLSDFSFMKMHLKMSSGKWRPFCLGLNVLIY